MLVTIGLELFFKILEKLIFGVLMNEISTG